MLSVIFKEYIFYMQISCSWNRKYDYSSYIAIWDKTNGSILRRLYVLNPDIYIYKCDTYSIEWQNVISKINFNFFVHCLMQHYFNLKFKKM